MACSPLPLRLLLSWEKIPIQPFLTLSLKKDFPESLTPIPQIPSVSAEMCPDKPKISS
jgi:hypothetical protein